MSKQALPPPVDAVLRKLGADIRLARRRRNETLRAFAKRLYVSVPTLQRLEAGEPGVGVGILANVLWALGLLDRLRKLTDPAEDKIGIELERRKRLGKDKSRTDFDF